jgi:ABC-type amino acid transport system permease subunit
VVLQNGESMELQIFMIIAIILGPLFAVLVTLWHQSRKEKRQNKFFLFRTLMTHRFGMPVAESWVEGLNSVDVVFHDKP